MSGDMCDFKNIETRTVIKFFFLQGKVPKEIHAILTETLGEHAPSYATIKNWVAQFKHGDFSTCGASHPGLPKTVTTPEIIDQIHELILEDRRILAISVLSNWASYVSGLGPSFMKIWTCGSSPQRIPKCLNADQKCQRRQSSEQLLEFFRRDPNDFLSRLVATDETWLYH